MTDSVNISRRIFLNGVLTVATVIVAAPRLLLEPTPLLYADGVHDDAPAINALFAGHQIRTLDGFSGIAKSALLQCGAFALGSTVYLASDNLRIIGSEFRALPGFKGDHLLQATKAHNVVVSDCRFDLGNVSGLDSACAWFKS